MRADMSKSGLVDRPFTPAVSTEACTQFGLPLAQRKRFAERRHASPKRPVTCAQFTLEALECLFAGIAFQKSLRFDHVQRKVLLSLAFVASAQPQTRLHPSFQAVQSQTLIQHLGS